MTTPIAFRDPSLSVARPRTKRRGRRRLVVGLTLLTTMGALALLGRIRLEQHIRHELLPSLSQRLGRKVDVGNIQFGFASAVLSEIRVSGPQDASTTPLLQVRKVEVDIDLRSILAGEIVVKHIAVEGVDAELRRDAAGEDNLSDLLRKLAALRVDGETEQPSVKPARTSSQRSRLRVQGATVHVKDIRVTVSDAQTEGHAVLMSEELVINAQRLVQLSGVVVAAQLSHGGHNANLDLEAGKVVLRPDGQVHFQAQRVRAGSSDPRFHAFLGDNPVESLYVERVRSQAGTWELNLVGEFDDSERSPSDDSEGLRAQERILVSGTWPETGGLRLRVAGSKVKMARLESLLPKGLGLRMGQGLASGAWTIDATADAFTAAGEVRVEGVSLSNRRLASVPVVMKPTLLSGHVVFDRTRGQFRTNAFKIESAGVPYRLSLDALLPGYAREEHAAPRLAASLSMPEVACQDMLDSLPIGIAPELDGFKLAGKTKGEVTLMVDWADFERTEFDPQVHMEGCQVLHAPQHLSAARLRGPFQHKVPVPGGWRSFLIGPENPDFVRLDKVSGNLRRSFLTTEDSAFYRHNGFITKEFRGALVKNLKRGRFAYGASSISMQVVKNVLLSREKTVARKVQELFLTWHLEQSLSKDRILEIYVNAIEFGPGLYGIKPAARQYFAKHPRALNPVESAFLSSLLPAPTRRYKQYCSGGVRRSTSAKIERILGFMHRRRRLSEEQYAAALETPLSFRGRRSALCQQPKLKNEGHSS